MKRMGLEVEKELPEILNLETGEIETVLPDPKFQTNPAKVEWKPNMAGFPESLKKIYRTTQKGK